MAQLETRERVLKYVSDFCDSSGYAPSYREIASAMGLQSTSSVAKHIRNLKEAGKLTAVYSA